MAVSILQTNYTSKDGKDKDVELIRPRSRPRPSDDGEDLFGDDNEDDEVTFKQGYFK